MRTPRRGVSEVRPHNTGHDAALYCLPPSRRVGAISIFPIVSCLALFDPSFDYEPK